MTTSNLARKIKALLVKQGKTQRQLAEYLDMKESNFSHALRRGGAMDEEKLIKIAKFFNKDVSHFDVGVEAYPQSSSNPDHFDEKDMLLQLLASKDALLKAKDELIEVLKRALENTPPEKEKT